MRGSTSGGTSSIQKIRTLYLPPLAARTCAAPFNVRDVCLKVLVRSPPLQHH
ncbi:hypothetical protein V6Z12_D08G173300 [Gossypium hirsutum]